MVPLSKIVSDSLKLRPLEESTIEDMMKSLTSKGQQQPIKLRRSGTSFTVTFGEHRLEAAKRLGWKEIWAIVEDITEDEALEKKVTENAHRNSFIDPVREGEAFAILLKGKYAGNLDALSESIGKSTQYIKDRTNTYYRLAPSLHKFVGTALTTTNAIQIAKLLTEREQIELANQIMGLKEKPPSWTRGIVYRTDLCTCSKCGQQHFPKKLERPEELR